MIPPVYIYRSKLHKKKQQSNYPNELLLELGILFTFYLGLLNGQQIPMKSGIISGRTASGNGYRPRLPDFQQQHMLFMFPLNLLVLKETYKIARSLYFSVIRVRDCNDNCISLLGPYSAEKCQLEALQVDVWLLVWRKQCRSICIHLTAGSVLGHLFYLSVLAAKRRWKLLDIILERKWGE